MMRRTFTVIALLLLVPACGRAPAGNNASQGNASAGTGNLAQVAAPAPDTAIADAPADDAAEDVEEPGTMAEEQATEPSADAEPAEGCAGEVGLPAARRLVEQCTEVSPATRPPCNTGNSCAMMRDEIKRGCSFLKEDAPAFCEEAG